MSRGERRPIRLCPVCGRAVFVSTVRAHVGSADCLVSLHVRRQGRPFDPDVGPVVLDLAGQLSRLLALGD